MKKTLRLTGGAILDIDPLELGDTFLSLAHNVNTRKGFPSRIGGRRVAYPVVSGHLPNTPMHHLNVFLNTFNWWMLFGASDIRAVESANNYDITFPGLHTVTDPENWVSTLLNGIPVFTNGHDPLLYWDGDSSHTALAVPGWPAGTVCNYVIAFKFHLFAFNIDEPTGTFDNKVMWSDAADPGTLPSTWTPGAGNEAGSAILADVSGPIVSAAPLGPQLIAYKPTAIYPIEYAGQPPDRIYEIRPAVRSIGALGPHCVRLFGKLGDRHLVLGNDDVVLFDGVNVQSIADNRVKLAIANSIDETYARNAFLIHDMNKREVWACIPEAGSQFATIAHVWDVSRDTWTTRDLNHVPYGTTGYVQDTTVSNTWNSDSQPWDLDPSAWNEGSTGAIAHITTTETNFMYVEDTADTLALTARLTKEDMSLDDSDQRKLTTRVTIEGSGPGLSSLQFRLGARNSTDDDDGIAWGAYVTRLSEGNPYEIGGRFISIDVRSTDALLWTVTRITIEGVYDGPF